MENEMNITKLSNQRVANLEFTPRVTSKELHVALDRLLDISGCPQCGLNGIDIRFSRILDLKKELSGLETLVNVG